MGSDSVTEADLHSEETEEHPICRSWHGTTRDEIDLVLEEYEIIPLDSITQVQVCDDDDEEEEYLAMDLDYVDANPELSCGNEHRFDY